MTTVMLILIDEPATGSTVDLIKALRMRYGDNRNVEISDSRQIMADIYKQNYKKYFDIVNKIRAKHKGSDHLYAIISDTLHKAYSSDSAKYYSTYVDNPRKPIQVGLHYHTYRTRPSYSCNYKFMVNDNINLLYKNDLLYSIKTTQKNKDAIRELLTTYDADPYPTMLRFIYDMFAITSIITPYGNAINYINDQIKLSKKANYINNTAQHILDKVTRIIDDELRNLSSATVKSTTGGNIREKKNKNKDKGNTLKTNNKQTKRGGNNSLGSLSHITSRIHDRPLYQAPAHSLPPFMDRK